ncbi:(2Fe-2S)-binding protein [Frankia sp. Cppng1_Ct_nod]|uniref:(2Fe-2S)-binding protein n=1 Tax=Frankia sp. Cppng1_Ct_nod TaxID=2897162 RepID=UPI00104160AA|nr:(2Fe-2S)-binding protein [Frankia sp. Cppng1_Ct_nod]
MSTDASGETGIGDTGIDDTPISADVDPRVSYHLYLDGAVREVADVCFSESLLGVLRDHLGVMSVKDACEQGRCGSCSVLMDGRLVASCTVLAADAADAQVTTVAGLGSGGPARAVRAAFLAYGAVQCGFCTPGFVVAVTDLLARRPDADEDEIREALAGNICRCTGYGRIIAAIRSVQDARR